jgi:hypothetical protein
MSTTRTRLARLGLILALVAGALLFAVPFL